MKCPHCGKWFSEEKRPDYEEFYKYCKELGLPDSDPEYLFNHWEANGWKSSGRKIEDWQAKIRSWKTAGYLPSQKWDADKEYSDQQAEYIKGWIPEGWRHWLCVRHPGVDYYTEWKHLPLHVKVEVQRGLSHLKPKK